MEKIFVYLCNDVWMWNAWIKKYAKFTCIRCIQSNYSSGDVYWFIIILMTPWTKLAMGSGIDDELWVRIQGTSHIGTLASECETCQVPGRPADLSSFDLRIPATGIDVTEGEGHWLALNSRRDGQKGLEDIGKGLSRSVKVNPMLDKFTVLVITAECYLYILI